MTFVESVKTCLLKYADFSGRATRSEYWWFFLFGVLGYALSKLAGDLSSSIFALATLLPSISVGARRLHDINKSGWVQLSWIIGYTLGSMLVLVSLALGFSTSTYYLISGVLIFLSAIYWIVLSVKPSDIGKNQYGEAP